MKNRNAVNNNTVEISKGKNVKQQFLSHISHGIRTPLNSIMGFSKLLLNSDFEDVAENSVYAERIIQSSNSLLKFVDDVIELSKIEASEYSINSKNYGLNNCLQEICYDYNNQFYDNKILNVLKLSLNNNAQEFYFNIDKLLLKKLIFRFVDILYFQYNNDKIELGFKYSENNNKVEFFIRPSLFSSVINSCVIENFNTSENYSVYEKSINNEVVMKIALLLNAKIYKETDKSKNVQYKLIVTQNNNA
jgi:signal transduction histidine kinase